MVNTKTAPYRKLTFTCLDCLKKELEQAQAAHDAGTLEQTGNWSPGQIMWHLARFFMFSMDGFDGRAPVLVRFIMKLMFKKSALGSAPMPAGFKLPKKAASMVPPDDVSFEQGMADLQKQLARLDAGEKMDQPSPILDQLTHDQWMTIQLKHAALHLGFLTFPAAAQT